MNALISAVAEALDRVPPAQLEVMAERLAQDSDDVLVGTDDTRQYVANLIEAARDNGLSNAAAAAYLRGAIAGYRAGLKQQTVQVVWSGPQTHAVPTRSTAQVLTELIDRAQRELLLVTYSARRYEPVTHALITAVARGVVVTVVVETLQGAGSALAGREPAAAFDGIPGVRLWHWPSAQREHPSAKMHAKLAVADRRELFVSSVNLTASGVERSIEAGLLVTGGSAPERAAEHVAELQAAGVLEPLRA